MHGSKYYNITHKDNETNEEDLEWYQTITKGSCSHDKAYIAIIITVLPLWAILTTLIVSVLISSLSSLTGSGGGGGGLSNQEVPVVTENLSFVDYTILIYFFLSLVFHASTYDFLQESFSDPAQAAYKGAIIGCSCFALTLLVGITSRYIIRHYYAIHNGQGTWAIVYYTFSLVILVPATGVWVYTALVAYNNLCSNEYNMWILSISTAVVEALALALACVLVLWLVQSYTPNYVAAEIVLPGDFEPPAAEGNKTHSKQRTSSTDRQMQQMHGLGSKPLAAQPILQQSWHQSPPPPAPHNVHYVVQPPYAAGAGYHTTSPYLINPIVTQSAPPYKTSYQPAGGGAGGYHYHDNQYSPYYPAANAALNQPQQQMPTITLAQLQQPQRPETSGHSGHHTVKTSSPRDDAGGGKEHHGGIKKVGSTESTGSNYYRQLMKNKGGVKSISQYGELMKQNKTQQKAKK